MIEKTNPTSSPPIIFGALIGVFKLMGFGVLFILGVYLIEPSWVIKASANIRGATELEKILRLGESSESDVQLFKQKGGLEYESRWKDFKVASLNVGYGGADRKVTTVFMHVHRNHSGYILASLTNFKEALKSECGSDWDVNPDQGAMDATGPTGIKCVVNGYGGPSQPIEVMLELKAPPAASVAELAQPKLVSQDSAISAQPTSRVLPKFAKGESYGVVRQQVLSQGWVPFRSETAISCGESSEGCKERPELDSCNRVGCIYLWKKNDVLVNIVTSGEIGFDDVIDINLLDNTTLGVEVQNGSLSSARGSTKTPNPSMPTGKIVGDWSCKDGNLLLADDGKFVNFNGDGAMSRKVGIINMRFMDNGRIVSTYDDKSSWEGSWTEEKFGDGDKIAYLTKWNGENFFALPQNLKGAPVREGRIIAGALLCEKQK